MTTTIKLKNGTGVPTAGALVQGEPAFDLTNKRLYTENAGGTVIEVGTNPSTLSVTGAATVGSTLGVTGAAIFSSTVAGAFNGTLGATTPASVAATTLSTTGDISLPDGAKAIFGAGSDLQIYHTGTNSTLVDSGTGTFYIAGTDIVFLDGTLSERYADFTFEGAAQLYHDNAAKLATTATGIDVTGTVTADGLTVDGTGAFSGAVTLNNAVPQLTLSNTSGTTKNNQLIYSDTGGILWRVGTDVSTNNNTNAYEIYQEGAGTRFTIAASGNVGIGTSSPQEKTHSAGRILSTTQYGSPTQRIGTSIGENGNTRADIDFRRWTGAAANHGVGMIDVADTGVMAFYTDSKTSNTPATTERMRIDASGNVGIGTSTLTGGNTILNLSRTGSGVGCNMQFANSHNGAFYVGLAGNTSGDAILHSVDGTAGMAFGTNNTERMRIDASGNVRIGTTTNYGTEKFTVAGTVSVSDGTYPYLNLRLGTGSHVESLGAYQDLIVGTTGASASTIFKTADTERMRLDASGNLLVGCTTLPSSSVKGAAFLSSADQGRLYVSADSTAARDLAYFINPNGVIGTITTTSSSTAYNTSSDERLKENITDANDAGDKIDAIKVRQYDWKTDGSHQDYGMVAQELMIVAPEAVHQPEDPDQMMGVDYSKLVPMMLKEIQSLRARISQLEGAN
jgi:hypothetical protein